MKTKEINIVRLMPVLFFLFCIFPLCIVAQGVRDRQASGEEPEKIPVYGFRSTPFIMHDYYDPCGAERVEDCVCYYGDPKAGAVVWYYIDFIIVEPMDILITNTMPKTQIKRSYVSLFNYDTGEMIESLVQIDGHRYNYERISEKLGSEYSNLNSFNVENLPPGRYYFAINGYLDEYYRDYRQGRIETMIVGTPAGDNVYKGIIPSAMDMEIPLSFPEGFRYTSPIDMGTCDENTPGLIRAIFLGEADQLLKCLDVYPEYKPYYYYPRYPDGKPGEISMGEYEKNFNPYKLEKDIFYEFTLKVPESAVSSGKIPTAKIQIESDSPLTLLDSKRNVLNSFDPMNDDHMETVLKPGKYFIVLEFAGLAGNIFLTGKFHESITDDDLDEGENDRDGETEPDNNGYDRQGSYGDDGAYLKGLTPVGKGIKTTCTYNVRSWLLQIENRDGYFSQSLGYDYIGNIRDMSWKTGVKTAPRSYAFTYDQLSRLTSADYTGIGQEQYSTFYDYDKHGNMLALQRYGKTDASTYGLIDDLTMNYNGNQLIKAEDAAREISLSESADFKDYSNPATEYTYNKNGAMVTDLNKGISQIQYNSLNLPALMDIKSPVAEARNEYTYSAEGQKLRMVQKWDPNYATAPVVGSAINTSSLTMSKTTDYVGNKIYENGSLKRILIDGGYIEDGIYYFYQTDHLGNNRAVVGQNGNVIQQTHYYPFGMAFAESTGQNKQPYKYNNKELDGMHGLNWYDYSARHLTLDVPRFTTVDPLAEEYYGISPYAYCANNPIKYVDPDGRAIGTIIGTFVGGAAGAYKAYKNDTDILAGAAEGAVSGAITGAAIDIAVAATVATGGGALVVIGAGIAAGAVGGAAGGIVGDITGQAVSQRGEKVQNISTENFASKAASGAMAGAVSGVTGGVVGALGKVATTTTKAVQATMSNSITSTATTLTAQGASQGTVNAAVNGITKGMGTVGSNTVNSMIKVDAATATVTETLIKVSEEVLRKRERNKIGFQ